MQLFTALMGNHHQGFYLCSPILWSADVEETTEGGSWESIRKMACGPLMSCHCPPSPLFFSFSLSLLFLHFCPVSLFLCVPGMPPIFLCSNYCLSKLCQRAEIVLMRGPAAFASVIWWVSLGTHKTRHTRGYVATSEPRGRPRLFLAPSRWSGGSHIILVSRRLKSIQLGWSWCSLPGKSEGLNLSCIMLGLDSSTCVQDLHVHCRHVYCGSILM